MEKLKDILAGIVGSENVSVEVNVRIAHSRDAGFEPRVVLGIVVRPQSTMQVSKIMQVANITETPVWLRGGASSTAGGEFPLSGGILLDVTSLNKIVEINEEELSVTAECRLTWSALEAFLRRKDAAQVS